MAKRVPGNTIRSAVIGYGPACNMGKLHATYMNDNPDFELKAIADTNPARGEEARRDFPNADFYVDPAKMLRRDDIDLVSCVVPHNVHAKVVLACLRAGKHAIVEKPMCINTKEATSMIETAKKKGLVFTVFQNRRLDGDYLAIREVIDQGLIGDVFQVDIFGGGYHEPRAGNWRCDKKTCGGALYDWGAHFVDWALGLVPAKIVNVTGFVHKLVWDKVTLEDQARAVIRFANGCVADITNSNIDMVGKERWRVLGTKGGITLGPNNTLKVRTRVDGYNAELSVPHKPTRWEQYYVKIADHLLRGGPLFVKPEEARRAIGVIESIDKSAKAKKSVPVPFE